MILDAVAREAAMAEIVGAALVAPRPEHENAAGMGSIHIWFALAHAGGLTH